MTSLAQWAYTFGIGLTIIAPSFQLWRISLIWVLGFSVLFLTAMCARPDLRKYSVPLEFSR